MPNRAATSFGQIQSSGEFVAFMADCSLLAEESDCCQGTISLPATVDRFFPWGNSFSVDRPGGGNEELSGIDRSSLTSEECSPCGSVGLTVGTSAKPLVRLINGDHAFTAPATRCCNGRWLIAASRNRNVAGSTTFRFLPNDAPGAASRIAGKGHGPC